MNLIEPWNKPVEVGFEPVYVRPPEELLTMEFLHALAKKNATLGLSSQKMMDMLQHRLMNSLRPILDPGGIDIRRQAEATNWGYGDDLGYRWNDRMLRFATEYPKRDPKCTLAQRLAYWDAFWKVCGQAIEID